MLDLAAVEAAAADGLTDGQIAARVGVCADTLASRLRDTPDVAAALARGRGRALGVLENTAFRCAEKALDDPRYQRTLLAVLRQRAGWADPSLAPGAAPPPDADRAALVARVEALEAHARAASD